MNVAKLYKIFHVLWDFELCYIVPYSDYGPVKYYHPLNGEFPCCFWIYFEKNITKDCWYLRIIVPEEGIMGRK